MSYITNIYLTFIFYIFHIIQVVDWYPHHKHTQETAFRIGDKIKYYSSDCDDWKYGIVDQILSDEYKINFGNSWQWIAVDKLRLDNNDAIIISGLICKSVEECLSLKRLINVLLIHKKGIDMNNNDLISFIHENKREILDDYHHILYEHLNEDKTSQTECNEQFNLIYKCIFNNKNNVFCDISNCCVYLRNNREREKTLVEYETDLAVYMDIVDSIHCYFIHSVDSGYKILDYNFDDDEKDINENENENEICFNDFKFEKIQKYINLRRKHVIEARGLQRFSHNKYQTNLDEINNNNNNNNSEFNSDENGNNVFGFSNDYWSNEYKSRRKYRSLQEELLNNKIYSIDQTIWNSVYKKSEILMNSYSIKSIKSSIDLLNLLNEIGNIISIILYCDYDTLRLHFENTFYKQKLNIEYDIWSQLLTETVNAYGIIIHNSKINSFYHCIANNNYYFTQFIHMFYAPMSTTTKLTIATIFANEDGLILQLNKYQNNLRSKYLRYFNCNLFTCNANENEILFLQPPVKYCYLKVGAILNIKTNQNYENYIQSINTFENQNQNINDLNMIRKLLCNYKQSPKYIIKSFKKWTNLKTILDMNLNILQKLNLVNCLIQNVIKFDKINKIFKNLRAINCYQIGMINDIIKYMQLLGIILTNINQIKHTKLQNINLHNITNIKSIQTPLQYQKIKWIIHKNKYDDKVGEYLNITVDYTRQTS